MNLIKHFTVYTCTGCGEVLGYESTLCERCLHQFKNETMLPCSACGQPHKRCSCSADNQLFTHAFHIAPYRDNGITRKLVLGSKKVKNAVLFDFIARTITEEMKNRFSLNPQTILVNVPRSGHAKRNYGFDQTEQIAKRIAASLYIDFVPALRHKGRTLQKTLNQEQRAMNAKEAFQIRTKYIDTICGKHIILYDDLVASGATALACARLLYGAGAASVDFASFAKREYKHIPLQ
ncbi:MAG: ComF family protein [Clostridiales bacterium]|nr:ComF family protein [Clostridiales bacterium]